jgi:hypothetical protein
MAPEQARGGYIDAPADLWGSGPCSTKRRPGARPSITTPAPDTRSSNAAPTQSVATAGCRRPLPGRSTRASLPNQAGVRPSAPTRTLSRRSPSTAAAVGPNSDAAVCNSRRSSSAAVAVARYRPRREAIALGPSVVRLLRPERSGSVGGSTAGWGSGHFGVAVGKALEKGLARRHRPKSRPGYAGTPEKRSCTKRTTIAPSPTAVAQRLMEPDRTSPAA